MEEKRREEFNKSWDIDYEKQKQEEAAEYKKHALELIAKAVCRNDLREIKEIIQELEDEIGTL